MKVGNENTKGSRATVRGFAPWLIVANFPNSRLFQDYLYHDSSKHLSIVWVLSRQNISMSQQAKVKIHLNKTLFLL